MLGYWGSFFRVMTLLIYDIVRFTCYSFCPVLSFSPHSNFLIYIFSCLLFVYSSWVLANTWHLSVTRQRQLSVHPEMPLHRRLIAVSSQHLTPTELFPAPIDFPFAECQISGTIQYGASWLQIIPFIKTLRSHPRCYFVTLHTLSHLRAG